MNLGSCLAKPPGELIARVVWSCRGGLGEAGGWGARGWRGRSTRPRPPQSAPLAVRFSKYSSWSGSPQLCGGGGKEPPLEASGDGEGEWPSAPGGPQRLVWPWLWGPALGPRRDCARTAWLGRPPANPMTNHQRVDQSLDRTREHLSLSPALQRSTLTSGTFPLAWTKVRVIARSVAAAMVLGSGCAQVISPHPPWPLQRSLPE
nr:uncharacterized protein LOC112934608 [Vulpes vulpes]